MLNSVATTRPKNAGSSHTDRSAFCGFRPRVSRGGIYVVAARSLANNEADVAFINAKGLQFANRGFSLASIFEDAH